MEIPVPNQQAPPLEVEVDIIAHENEPEPLDNGQIFGLEGENDSMQNLHLNFTNNNPLGKIIISMMHDISELSRAVKRNRMESNLPEICENFYNANMLEQNRLSNKLKRSAMEIQQNIIQRELNSHLLNQSVEPPLSYSKVPTLHTAKQRADCMKLFPYGSHKFSGDPRDNAMNILEYLSLVNAAQDQCNLSENEFKQMLLASTTGRAHMLLLQWMGNNDDPSTIYHNLLLHFDHRLSPEDARSKLHSYKVPKSSNLAKALARIMDLAGRASMVVPKGPSRTAMYEMEIIQGLIRSLPPQSSMLVQNINNQLSARLKRAAKPIAWCGLTQHKLALLSCDI